MISFDFPSKWVCRRRSAVKKLILVMVLLGIVVAGLSAEKAKKGFYLNQSIQGSFNPLGLQFLTQAYYRIPLVNKEGILWESTKIDIGLQNNLSPAFDAVDGAADGVSFLARAAMREGATKEEIAETLRVAAHLGGVGCLYTASAALKELFP
jgi:alkylhydroperoxidase/carboxymuconolactone decarboxylase family protein YurZ